MNRARNRRLAPVALGALLLLASAATSVAKGGSCCDSDASSRSEQEAAVFGAGLYGDTGGELPDTATMVSLGCGNPTAVATFEAAAASNVRPPSSTSATRRRLPFGVSGGVTVLHSGASLRL